MCLPGTALNIYEECIICELEKGYKIENDHCVCALERGMIIDDRGNCVCPEDHGYKLSPTGECTRIIVPECKRNDDCPDYQYCELSTNTCEDPCLNHQCGVNAFCNATNHGNILLIKSSNFSHSKKLQIFILAAKCQCITNYNGDPDKYCGKYHKLQKVIKQLFYY